jgi:hypothetical protein
MKCAHKKLLQVPNKMLECIGTGSRDFLLLVFFMNQFSPSLRVSHEDRFKFFRKFTVASQGAPLVAKLQSVSTAPAANLPPVSMTLVANNGNNIRLLRP